MYTLQGVCIPISLSRYVSHPKLVWSPLKTRCMYVNHSLSQSVFCSEAIACPDRGCATHITSRVVVKRVSCLLHVRVLALVLWLSAHLPAAYAFLCIPFTSVLHVLVTMTLLCATNTGTISVSALESEPAEAAERGGRPVPSVRP